MPPHPTGRVSRPQVLTALHTGMADAIRDYAQWTKGETLTAWASEGFLVTYCARALTRTIDRSDSAMSITLEQHFGEVLDHSQRLGKKGRRFKHEEDLLSRPSRRVDLLLWNAKNTPRAVIEIKRSAGIGGLRADAGRICQFVRYAGKAYDGSIQYGVLATTAQLAAGSSSAAIDRFHQPRREALQQVAHAHDMVLETPPPRTVSVRDLHVPCLMQTMVYVFRG